MQIISKIIFYMAFVSMLSSPTQEELKLASIIEGEVGGCNSIEADIAVAFIYYNGNKTFYGKASPSRRSIFVAQKFSVLKDKYPEFDSSYFLFSESDMSIVYKDISVMGIIKEDTSGVPIRVFECNPDNIYIYNNKWKDLKKGDKYNE